MICKTCGYEIADNSTFCVHCGSSVYAYAQPQYQQPIVQAPVDNDTINDNYYRARKYIEIANSILGPAIAAFILTNYIIFIGQIYAFVKRSSIKKKIAELPDVDESLLDPVTYGEYKTARGKVTAAKRFSKIAYVLSVILFVILALEIAALLIILALEVFVVSSFMYY